MAGGLVAVSSALNVSQVAAPLAAVYDRRLEFGHLFVAAMLLLDYEFQPALGWYETLTNRKSPLALGNAAWHPSSTVNLNHEPCALDASVYRRSVGA